MSKSETREIPIHDHEERCYECWRLANYVGLCRNYTCVDCRKKLGMPTIEEEIALENKGKEK